MFNTKVLSNPFEDIAPREKEKTVEKESVDKKEKKKKGTKYVTSLQLLVNMISCINDFYVSCMVLCAYSWK